MLPKLLSVSQNWLLCNNAYAVWTVQHVGFFFFSLLIVKGLYSASALCIVNTTSDFNNST